MLKGVHAQALEPEKIGALIHFIKEDLGFHLHRAVQKVKVDLSNECAATFRFSDGFVDLKAVVERSAFEEWISEELGQIEQLRRCSAQFFRRSAEGRRYGLSDGRLVLRSGGQENLRNAIRREANSGRERVYVGGTRIGAESAGVAAIRFEGAIGDGDG